MCGDASMERGSPKIEFRLRTTKKSDLLINSHLNVVDDESVDVQSLVVGIGFGVLQQLKEKVGGFLWPATDGSSPCLSLGSATNTAVETAEWNTFLSFSNVLQETLSATEGHAFNRKCCLACVLQGIKNKLVKLQDISPVNFVYLEMNSQVVTSGLA